MSILSCVIRHGFFVSTIAKYLVMSPLFVDPIIQRLIGFAFCCRNGSFHHKAPSMFQAAGSSFAH
jgi:hypothetical protein